MENANPYTEIRAQILAAALDEVSFTGWTPKTLEEAVQNAKVDADMAQLAFPDGVAGLIKCFSEAGDQAMQDNLPAVEGLKIRERISHAVMARLQADQPHRDAARRAAAWLSVPGRQALAARLLFTSAHHMWHWAGDTATDYNYYSKRTILSGVIATTRLVWFDDDSEDLAATRAFLDRRIDNVMQFEKAKAKVTKMTAQMQADGSGFAGALAKLAQWRFGSKAE